MHLMLLWNFQEAGRADGKEIPSTTLERMISRNSDAARKTCRVFPGCSCLCKVLRWGYEPLPEEVKGWAQPTRRIRFMKFNQIPCPKDVAQSFSNDFLQRVPQHPNNHQQPSTNATKTYQEIYQEQDQHLEDLVKTWSLQNPCEVSVFGMPPNWTCWRVPSQSQGENNSREIQWCMC